MFFFSNRKMKHRRNLIPLGYPSNIENSFEVSSLPSDSRRKNTRITSPMVSIEFFIIQIDCLVQCFVFSVIPSVLLNKSDRPNSIRTRTLKLLNKNKLDQLAILFKQSFSSGIFPLILEASKIIPI